MVAEEKVIEKLSSLLEKVYTKTAELEKATEKAEAAENMLERANIYKEKVCTKMEELREVADTLELITAKKYWPMPTYGDLMFKV